MFSGSRAKKFSLAMKARRTRDELGSARSCRRCFFLISSCVIRFVGDSDNRSSVLQTADRARNQPRSCAAMGGGKQGVGIIRRLMRGKGEQETASKLVKSMTCWWAKKGPWFGIPKKKPRPAGEGAAGSHRGGSHGGTLRKWERRSSRTSTQQRKKIRTYGDTAGRDGKTMDRSPVR